MPVHIIKIYFLAVVTPEWHFCCLRPQEFSAGTNAVLRIAMSYENSSFSL